MFTSLTRFLLDQEEENKGEIKKLDFKHIINKCKQKFYPTHLLLGYCSASYPLVNSQVSLDTFM